MPFFFWYHEFWFSFSIAFYEFLTRYIESTNAGYLHLLVLCGAEPRTESNADKSDIIVLYNTRLE